MLPDALPQDMEPTLRLVPMPKDTNAAGDIFGGWIMSWVDVAGAIAAARRANGRVTTVAVNAFQFNKPVFVNDLVSFYARVERVGTTSLTIGVRVYAQRGWHSTDPGESVMVTEATLTYVALDERGNKRPVPPAAKS
jgi:acyl-CoA thioesterase YciA